jgi:hypothetical protein
MFAFNIVTFRDYDRFHKAHFNVANIENNVTFYLNLAPFRLLLYLK